MRKFRWLATIVAAGVGALTLVACLGSGAWSGTWTSVFPVEPDELVSTGRNPYFILEPGYTLVLAGGGAQLTITVLNETKKVDGVETRVVEERETKGGQLIEVARNYFAISKRTGDVFYFGEDVDMYKDGKIANHDGTWITHDMMDAYVRLAELGYAHSVEAWEEDELAGGLYGVALGRVFYGESMSAGAVTPRRSRSRTWPDSSNGGASP